MCVHSVFCLRPGLRTPEGVRLLEGRLQPTPESATGHFFLFCHLSILSVSLLFPQPSLFLSIFHLSSICFPVHSHVFSFSRLSSFLPSQLTTPSSFIISSFLPPHPHTSVPSIKSLFSSFSFNNSSVIFYLLSSIHPLLLLIFYPSSLRPPSPLTSLT